MANLGYRVGARVPEAERAVELSRSLLRKGPSVERRVLLARSLDALGTSLPSLARFTPNERSAFLKRGLDATRESLELYSALQREKVSTEEIDGYARSARLRVANIQARLAQVSPAVSSRQ